MAVRQLRRKGGTLAFRARLARSESNVREGGFVRQATRRCVGRNLRAETEGRRSRCHPRDALNAALSAGSTDSRYSLFQLSFRW
jgi:hypothetical protein